MLLNIPRFGPTVARHAGGISAGLLAGVVWSPINMIIAAKYIVALLTAPGSEFARSAQ
jgi:hypothetical protein